MRIVAVAQARLGSTRLPGKVLERIGTKTILHRVVDSLRAAESLDDSMVAVPASDDSLIRAVRLLGVEVVEGPADDVLTRFVVAAARARADVIVRVTADCPLLDPGIVDAAVHEFRLGSYDYLSVEGFPRGVGEVEVVTRSALEAASAKAADARDREHVTTYVRAHDDRFSVRISTPPPELYRPSYRVCVDEPADLEAVRLLHARLGCPERPVSAREIVAALDASPEIVQVNRHVNQRS